jgi:hypothetical protein
MNNFCTLFDSNYFSRGLTLYNSLDKYSVNFHIYIFAFDDKCYDRLTKMKLDNATIVSLSEFEDQELLNVKPTRTRAEYCWTCTSSTILYCIEHFNLESCTYIDADICFYSDPKIVFEEIGTFSVALTDHNYTKLYDDSATSGKYCVQFVYFKNDETGLKALKWWRDACITWCFARLEDGKFGDQKYLNDWTERFDNVHVIENLGVGIAPWNIQKYNVLVGKDNELSLVYKNSEEPINIVFYHFHGLKYKKVDHIIEIVPTKYKIVCEATDLIYVPYLKNLLKIDEQNNKQLTEFVFRKHSLLMKLYLPYHFQLKNFLFLQKIKAFFVKSIK